MQHLLDISADEIVSWGSSHAAEGALPDLVRRLLLATPGIQRVAFLTGKGNHLPGKDGTVSALGVSLVPGLIPDGDSIWEISSRQDKDVLKKIGADRDQRAAELVAGSPTSFVAVTNKRVSPDDKDQLEREVVRLRSDKRG
jgi:hypothetical protein